MTSHKPPSPTSTAERVSRLSPEKLALLKEMMAKKAEVSEPIAIVAMGGRYAGASDLRQYWQLIHGAIDKTGEIPPSRWNIDDFYDPQGQTPGKMTTRWGGFLADIDRFDAAFFGIAPREAQKMDPQHRLLLEVVWEALEYGGQSPSALRESPTGVFIGVGGVDYSRIPVQLDNYFEQITAYSGTGNALSIAANRISYALDLRGPSMSIDTACSSSLVAAHLAIASLRCGECDTAIVGGVNAILTPETTLAFSQAQMLSPEGKCRPFDHRANGYVRGEGCGVVVLRRLSDAVRRGDHVLATIRGSAINQDGQTSGISAPRGSAQVAVVRQALRAAGLTPDDVSYIEAHGTATPLGDPIEINALVETFRTSSAAGPCYLGSVKANVGHTETAAGMASLLKTVLMLQHRTIPKQTHFEKLNPHINLSGSRLLIPEENLPWQYDGRPLIAGISSFGFGGANAHLIVEAASAQPVESQQPERSKHLLTLSAKTPERLTALVGRYHEQLANMDDDALPDVCHTAAVGRSHFPQRLALPVESMDQLRGALAEYSQGKIKKPARAGKARTERQLRTAFMFPGQGTQFPGMGRPLYQAYGVFRDALNQCDEILAEYLPERLLSVLWDETDTDRQSSDDRRVPASLIHQNSYTQVALFSIQYAMARLWRSWGVEPDVLIGHSVGDYVAACQAGVFSLADALKLVAHRGRLVQSLPAGGMMAAVMADRQWVTERIARGDSEIAIALHNGPENVVISGHQSEVQELLAQFESEGVAGRVLQVSHAMHSPLLDPILDEFESIASQITYAPPKVPLISSRDGRLLDHRVCQAAYWRDQLRGTVEFVAAVQTLQAQQIDAAIEIGPGSTLCSLAARIAASAPHDVSPTHGSGGASGGVAGSGVAISGVAISGGAGSDGTVSGGAGSDGAVSGGARSSNASNASNGSGPTIAWLTSLRESQDVWDTTVQSLAQLYALGADLQWDAFDGPWPRRRCVLPSYPFDDQRFWYDMSHQLDGLPRRETGLANTGKSIHPLVGGHVPLASDKTVYQARIRAVDPAFLNDHRVEGSVVFPAAGYMAQAIRVAKECFGEGDHTLGEFAIQQPLAFSDDQPKTVQIQIGPEVRSQCSFEVFSRAATGDDSQNAAWTLHASGTLTRKTKINVDSVNDAAGSSTEAKRNTDAKRIAADSTDADSTAEPGHGVDLTKIAERMTHEVSADSFYDQMHRAGLQYGPSFRVLEKLHIGQGECLAKLMLPQALQRATDEYPVHPTIWDGCLQAIAGVIIDPESHQNTDLGLPIGAHCVQVSGSAGPGPLWVHVQRRDNSAASESAASNSAASDSFAADLSLYDERGNLIAQIIDQRVQSMAKHRHDAMRSKEDLIYHIDWQSQAPVDAQGMSNSDASSNGASETIDALLMFADQGSLSDAIAQLAAQRGMTIVKVTPGQGFTLSNNPSNAGLDVAIDPASESDYQRLLQTLADRRWARVRVIDLWATHASAIDDSGSGSGSKSDSGSNADSDTSPDMNTPAQRAERLCAHLLRLLSTLGKSQSVQCLSTLVVTRDACAIDGHEGRVDPAHGSLWGMCRSAMVELPHLGIGLLDLDADAIGEGRRSQTASALLSELTEINKPGNRSTVDSLAEDHVAYRGDRRLVARLKSVRQQNMTPDASADVSPDASPDASNQGSLASVKQSNTHRNVPARGRYSLRVDRSGTLDGLHYESIAPSDLQAHEVEIRVHSTGLNFSDVLKALGLYPGMKDQIVPLGIECAGVVTAVGSGVSRFRVGQRVMGVAPYSFASHTIAPEYTLVATPETLSDDQAATVPITFLTAYHGLCRLARLAPGESVLIHAAAGGVGQAAIQIARSIGATIYATAGSDEKRDFLRSLGIEHVMDSRSLDFGDQILQLSGGRGVDVVLNSLPGDAISKSLSILAAYGRFLEIGKTDIYQNRRIGLLPFQDNLSYFAIDLDRMLRQRPDEIRSLYDEVMPQFAKGTFTPIPLQAFAAENVIDAFRYMAQRKNIGKVVVTMGQAAQSDAQHDAQSGILDQRDACQTPVDDRSHAQRVPSAAGQTIGQQRIADAHRGTVLITGGAGALGQLVAKWAIERGASHLAILTRRSPDEIPALTDSLATQGVQVCLIQGDVADQSSLSSALSQLPASFPPVRGVIHAAGVLRDGLLHSMQREQLTSVMAPKSRGAWNLHQAFGSQLSYFVMFSSVAGTLGSPGQSNYAAGNAFMDALAMHRNARGLPAISIAWGPWDAAGMAADAQLQRQLNERGMTPLSPAVGMNMLDAVLNDDAAHVAVMDVDWKRMLSKLPGDGSSLLALNRSDITAGDGDSVASGRDEQLCRQLAALSADDRLIQLEALIADSLAEVLGVEASTIDAGQALASLGLDSLMGMELRSSLEAQLGIEIPVASMFDNPSVRSLARVAAKSFDAGVGDTQVAASNEADKLNSRQSGDASRRATRALAPARRNDLVGLGGTQGDQPPLFCIHPVGGDLRCYDSFARQIEHRWVYGLRARGLGAGSQAHESIDQLVDDYTATIRSAAGDGPYCLMGWSTGGIFAYEIARRLHQQQLPVQPLILVDTPLPEVFEDIDLADDARFLVDLIEFTNYFAGTSMRMDYATLHQMTQQQAMATVLELAIEHNILPANTTQEYVQRLINVCRSHVRLLQGYHPPASDLVGHMLRPEDTSILSEATGRDNTDLLGWGDIARLTLHRVGGHHFTMMTDDNAPTLARKVDELLRSAARSASQEPVL